MQEIYFFFGRAVPIGYEIFYKKRTEPISKNDLTFKNRRPVHRIFFLHLARSRKKYCTNPKRVSSNVNKTQFSICQFADSGLAYNYSWASVTSIVILRKRTRSSLMDFTHTIQFMYLIYIINRVYCIVIIRARIKPRSKIFVRGAYKFFYFYYTKYSLTIVYIFVHFQK